MRTFYRMPDASAAYGGRWVVVSTDENGDSSFVWLVTLIQVLLLNLGESPFFAAAGIPAKPAVIQQLFPDHYVTLTQQQFAGYFASLIITKQPSPTPTYTVNVVTKAGAKWTGQVALA